MKILNSKLPLLVLLLSSLFLGGCVNCNVANSCNVTNSDETKQGLRDAFKEYQELLKKDTSYNFEKSTILSDSHNLGEPITQNTGQATWDGEWWFSSTGVFAERSGDTPFTIDFNDGTIKGDLLYIYKDTPPAYKNQAPSITINFNGEFGAINDLEQGQLSGTVTEVRCKHDYITDEKIECDKFGSHDTHIAGDKVFIYNLYGSIGVGGAIGIFGGNDLAEGSFKTDGHIHGGFIATPTNN